MRCDGAILYNDEVVRMCMRKTRLRPPFVLSDISPASSVANI